LLGKYKPQGISNLVLVNREARLRAPSGEIWGERRHCPPICRSKDESLIWSIFMTSFEPILSKIPDQRKLPTVTLNARRQVKYFTIGFARATKNFQKESIFAWLCSNESGGRLFDFARARRTSIPPSAAPSREVSR
jgi:hypothetical protein